LYVWFEAVIGYLSASKEWAIGSGDVDKWQDFWQEEARSYYFIGKDNIPFHTIIWPAMLLGHGNLNLPYDVPANEYLTIEGRKLSSSRNWAVWLDDFLSRYEADPLRYLLSINMPQTGDTDFSWREFVRRNNDELVATYGNLAQRVLTFVYRNYEGKIPLPGELNEESKRLMDEVIETFDEVDRLIGLCSFKEAIKKAMTLAHNANRYLEVKSPWKVIKQDKQAAATSLYVILCVLSALRILFYPFLPSSSQKLHEYLGFEGNVEDDSWQLRLPPTGQHLKKPEPLFKKLDKDIIEQETGRLGQDI
jgi:methionyl-tRNA synthetase